MSINGSFPAVGKPDKLVKMLPRSPAPFLDRRHSEVKAMPAAVLAMAKDPNTAKARAAKARAFVEKRQQETLHVLATNL